MSAAGLIRAQVAAMVEAAFDEARRYPEIGWDESQSRQFLRGWLAADSFTAMVGS